jgi:hypothetical protein
VHAVTIQAKSTLLLIVPVLGFGLIGASAPAPGWTRVLTVGISLGLAGFFAVRVARMCVRADRHGVLVRNLGSSHRLPWKDVEEIMAGRSDNASGAVTTILIRRTDGTTLVARAASAYSTPAVERWRDRLVSARPDSN